MTELTFKYKSDPVQAQPPASSTPPRKPQKPGKWVKLIAIFGLIAAMLTFLTWVIRAWLVVRHG